MLSIQSVNSNPAFGRRYSRIIEDIPFENIPQNVSIDDIYSKEQFKEDKSRLEGQLDELNAVIDNVNVPKPVRAFGKVVSIGIGAALGFVSMKFGAQGVTKLLKKGYNALSKFAQKPILKPLLKAKEFVGKKVNQLVTNLSNFGHKHKLSNKFMNGCDKLKNNFKETKVYNKLSNITKENVEKGVVNLFGVSGGVTGGITALEGVTSKKE